jgi:hypothetical protein
MSERDGDSKRAMTAHSSVAGSKAESSDEYLSAPSNESYRQR